MNSSNFPNNKSTNSEILTHILNYGSIALNFFTLALCLAYSLFIFIFKKLRKRHYLYMNHANLCGIVYAAMAAGYSISPYPNFTQPELNLQICLMSEILWIFGKYIRMYSIILVAVYRFIAIFKFNWYRRLNTSYVYLCTPIVFVWFWSLGLPLASKYIFGTSINKNNSFYCLDGYSKSSRDVLSYFFFNYTFMLFLPTAGIVFMYIRIMQKLNDTRYRLRKIRITNRIYDIFMLRSIQMAAFKVLSSNIDEAHAIRNRKKANQARLESKNEKERKFANQFLVMCTLMVFTAIGWSIYQLRNMIPEFFTVWVNWRIVIRIWCALMLAAIPITTVYFIPGRRGFLKFCTKRKHEKKQLDLFVQ